jgi:hypothetical protein
MAKSNTTLSEYDKEPPWLVHLDQTTGAPIKVYNTCVHHFSMGDVDDPEIYAAGPLWDWQNSEAGKWVTKHAVEKPRFCQSIDVYNLGYKYLIYAKLADKDYTFWCLKWGKPTTPRDIC